VIDVLVSVEFLVYRWLYYVKMDSAAQHKVICDTDITEVRAESCSNVKFHLEKSSQSMTHPDKELLCQKWMAQFV
jgi:hypothetical protein